MIRTTQRPSSRAARADAVTAVLLRVLLLNLLVVVAKAAAFVSSNALSVAAEVMHSSLDVANNVLGLWLARVAGQEPDAEHPYGHQKFETLGALIVVAFLSVTVFELGKGAVRRLMATDPPTVEGTPLAIVVLAASVVAGLAVSVYEVRRGRALGSDLLLADAAHTRSDVLSTLAVLGGLILVSLGGPRVDPILALAVAAVIARTGWKIIVRSIPVLVDERAVDEARIRTLVEAEPHVVACYSIRSRGREGAMFAELTIAVDPALDVASSHDIADAVEQRVANTLGVQDVVVHVEPAER